MICRPLIIRPSRRAACFFAWTVLLKAGGATFVNAEVAGNWFKDSPETSWRYVFLFGLIPAVIAFLVRLFVKEPERWQRVAATSTPPKLSELFTPQVIAYTRSGFLMAVIALLTWWSCNAFIPVVSSGLARANAEALGLGTAATLQMVEHWKTMATTYFNLGGLIGTLLTIPASKLLGRKKMFTIYWIVSSLAVFGTFGLDLAPEMRLYGYFVIGLSVFGVFGSFTYYLPELFPTRLRGTGAGFCYNVGRVVAAGGPFLVGAIASQGVNAATSAVSVLFYVGFIPLIGILLMPWVIETKGRVLSD